MLNKDVNNPFKVSEFHVSSVFLLFIESTKGSKSVLSINNILIGLSREFPSGGFRVLSDLKINSEFFEIGFSFFGIEVESGDFFGGLDLISGGIESGLDFVGFEGFDTFSEMVFESVEHGRNFVVDGSDEVRSVDGGDEMFGIKSISVVIGNNSTSSRFNIIHVFEILLISVNIGDFNILEELFHGVDLEKMFVLGEFVGESTLLLGEDWGITSSFSSG